RASWRYPDAILPVRSWGSFPLRAPGWGASRSWGTPNRGRPAPGRGPRSTTSSRRATRTAAPARSAGIAPSPRASRSGAARRGGAGASCLFVPHLLPVSGGIISTMYVPMEGSASRLEQLFVGAYADEPFIVLRGAEPPELREVRGTNRCAIGWHWDGATGRAV